MYVHPKLLIYPSLLIVSATQCRPVLLKLSPYFHFLSTHCPLALATILLHLDNHSGIAAAAKLLQSCPTLCNPIDGSSPGSPVPGILQARTLEWLAISFSNAGKWKVRVKSLSGVWLLATPWTAAYQAPLSMGFSRQEYWSGVPLPFPWHMLLFPYSSFSILQPDRYFLLFTTLKNIFLNLFLLEYSFFTMC